MRSLRIGLFAVALATANACAADAITAEQLMQRLAQTKASRVGFTDRKYLSSLDRPLESSGELLFTAPSRLEKRTIKPKPETLVVDGNTVTIERNGTRRSLSLTSYPEIAALTDSIRATLSGDLATLTRDYRVVVDGTAAQWKLTLLPSDAKIAQIVSRVTIDGRENRIESFEVLQADGNRSVTTIAPLAVDARP
jgi:outer membrane lipoprotein-sorting protein